MSRYFDDYPKENPNNGVGKQFNFELTQYFREQQEQKALKREFLEKVVDCPECGNKELNCYHFTAEIYQCECQHCGAYGSGTNEQEAYSAIECVSDKE
ncbi:hypothetical protein [Aliivibrio salmonicida]|uniref:Uncharacterized protein n=1 Tax=Aliivibrio salmonicida (strain LFI1238) TaxID=316275 RepID=B6ERZ2_ALISL|nr:hypothetical protein [Aliivibrio salmonicida]AZL86815.1 hypothetical protein EIJ81_21150 [Aliivibrio salmonicida]CAQ81476.1 hypothetical protein VSAL_II0722 [Aliivibrio salmonicida LFI1238]